MPKPTTESHLALLRQLRATPDSPTTLPALEKLLTHKSLHGIVLKSIAALAEALSAKQLAPALAAAAADLLPAEAAKRDPGCEALTALLKTLLAWDTHAPDLYLAASTLIRLTPTFGDPIDSAAEPRGLAAIGIALTQPPDAILRLTDLLADKEKVARAHAARALSVWRGTEALPLLRLKARLGDDDPDTLAEVLAALLHQDPKHLPFVAAFLHTRNNNSIEAAALALGQSKLPEALAPLAAAYPAHAGSPTATTLLMAISLLRTSEALDFLLTQLKSARPREATNLLDALALHKHDPKLMTRLSSLITTHPTLKEPFTEIFGLPTK